MRIVNSLFYPLKNTAHTCDFNSIVSLLFILAHFVIGLQETLWSVAKHNMDKLLMLQTTPLTKETFHELVNLSISMIPQKTLIGIIDSNRWYIAKMLKP